MCYKKLVFKQNVMYFDMLFYMILLMIIFQNKPWYNTNQII